MSINNGIGSRPLGWYEIANLLHCGEDEGQCCTSRNINKWSRKKPMFIGSRVLESPDKSSNVWAEYGFGLTPPSVRGLLFNEIENNENWNAQEWEFDPTANPGPFRLDDFNGYHHLIGAPFDVPGMILPTYETSYNGSTSNDERVLVFDISIPITPSSYGIGMFELPQFKNSLDSKLGYRLCLLARCTSGASKGEWFVHEDSQTLSSYASSAGTMDMIEMKISVAEMRQKFTTDIGTTYGDYMDLEWWLCATAHSETTNSAWQAPGWNQPVDLKDATTNFLSLPTSRPEACHGKVTYEGKATPSYSLSISFWGINNNDTWMPYMGMLPPTSVVKFGQMLQDYNYGLQVGITITNNSEFAIQLSYNSIAAIVSNTFDSDTPKNYFAPMIWRTTSTAVNTSLEDYATAIGTYIGTSVSIPAKESIHLILDLGSDVMGSFAPPGTPTGQTIEFGVTAVVNNYWRETFTFKGSN